MRLSGYQFHCQSKTLDYQFRRLFFRFSNTWSRIAGYIVDYISFFLKNNFNYLLKMISIFYVFLLSTINLLSVFGIDNLPR